MVSNAVWLSVRESFDFSSYAEFRILIKTLSSFPVPLIKRVDVVEQSRKQPSWDTRGRFSGNEGSRRSNDHLSRQRAKSQPPPLESKRCRKTDY